MAGPIYANNIAGVLNGSVAPADGSIVLVSAATFPALSGGNYYYATIVHVSTGLVEIVKVTGKSSNTLTVVRGQDGTTASSFATGSLVELRVTAQVLRELDFRTFFGTASGLATLDATTRLTQAQIPTNVPLLTAGKLDIAVIPTAVAMDTDLATKANLASPVFTGIAKAASLIVNEAGNTTDYLQVGNNVKFFDGGAPNAVILKGIDDPTIGYIRFGNASLGFGWNGTKMVYGLSEVWHAGTFDPATKLNTASPSGTGTLTMTGTIKSSGTFESTTANVILTGSGTGNVILRPKGAAVTTSQAQLDQAGLFTAIDIQSTSDRDLKDNLIPMEIREDLADQIELWSWFWKGSGAPGRGPVAQEVLEYAPQFVGRGGGGFLSLDKAGLALAAIPGIAARLRRLEAVLNVRMESCSLVN